MTFLLGRGYDERKCVSAHGFTRGKKEAVCGGNCQWWDAPAVNRSVDGMLSQQAASAVGSGYGARSSYFDEMSSEESLLLQD